MEAPSQLHHCLKMPDIFFVIFQNVIKPLHIDWLPYEYETMGYKRGICTVNIALIYTSCSVHSTRYKRNVYLYVYLS